MKRAATKRMPTVLLPLLFTSLLLNAYFVTKQPSEIGTKVIGVLDGDTLVLEGKTKVRLRYVDAPEVPNCGSAEATKTLEKLTLNKKARVEQIIPDQYGRGMGMVYIGDTLVNLAMVKSGWVRYHSDITPESDAIQEVGAAAREKKLGIYGRCQSTENKDNPSCAIKGNIDKSTDTHIYYVLGCAQYPFAIVEKDIGEQWFCTEKDAQAAGYVKAKTCTSVNP